MDIVIACFVIVVVTSIASSKTKNILCFTARYRGYYYDNETGYYYIQSRYYDPDLGRFISADSFNYIDTSTPLSVNAYAYCANNPLIYTDSTGCDFTWDTILKILKMSITLDFMFPEFRFTPIKHKTPNMTPSRKPNTTIFNCDNLTATIATVITEIFACLDLQEIVQKLEKEYNIKIDFSFNNFYEYFEQKVSIYRTAFDVGVKGIDIPAKGFAANFSSYLSSFSGFLGLFRNDMPDYLSAAFAALPYEINTLNDYSGRYLSPFGSFFMTLYDTIIGGIIDLGSYFISLVSPLTSVIFGIFADDLYNTDDVRKKAEFWAYNWYYIYVYYRFK